VSALRCHICERPVDHDRDPYYVATDPGHYDDEDDLEVALDNGIFFPACFSCWLRWPSAHKRPIRIGASLISVEELVELLA
jgi:hypothetical protein